jgi:hypothetical protein
MLAIPIFAVGGVGFLIVIWIVLTILLPIVTSTERLTSLELIEEGAM